MAFKMHRDTPRQFCTYCGKRTHPTRLCPNTHEGSTLRRLLYCTYCGKRDHDYEACPKIHAAHNRNTDRFIQD